MTQPLSSPGATLRIALVVGALGVVFGDIGTSPIYTLQTVFNPQDPHPVPATHDNIVGVVSTIVWSVVLIVTVTYVLLAMRMDNDGEGGIMALITLLRRWVDSSRRRTILVLSSVGILGAALFLGDSMITPAISVLSAVEGVKVVNPDLADWVLPITVTIVVVLFLVQRFGSASVGRVFGPVMIAWFVAIGVLGVSGISRDPSILLALSPTYAIGFLVGHFKIAFFALAAIVLSVTGAEALYADLGHFGSRPIRVAWLFLVFPACALSYLGQGGLLLQHRANLSAPFFLLAPGWAQLPLVILATAATVIASQAVISGAFSVAEQASKLGYLPRLRVQHTSTSTYGQVYVPWINWLLLVSVVTLVLAFRSSAALAFAFGMAVTGTITITTCLFFYLARRRWHTPLWLVIVGATLLLTVDLLFLAANLTKLIHGAWLPLAIGIIVFTIMITWRRGREIVTSRRIQAEGPLRDFVDRLHTRSEPLAVVEGTAIFLNRDPSTTPLALRANVEYNHVRHHHIVIVSVIVDSVPRVPQEKRVAIDDLGDRHDGITQITLTYGYLQDIDIPSTLRTISAKESEGRLDLSHATYFISRIDIVEGPDHDLARWRKKLFLATSQISADPSEHFGLPRNRVVVIASQVEI